MNITTIVMAAVIAAVVKELTSVIIKRTPAIVRQLNTILAPRAVAFLRRYWRVLYDFAGMTLSVVGFIWLTKVFPSVTHASVFFIAQMAAWSVYWTANLMQDLKRIFPP